MTAPELRPTADGPARTTVAWVHTVATKGRLDLAWPLTDEPLRLALVQQWILDQERRFAIPASRDEVAAALAAEHPRHPAWRGFARWRVERWQATWSDLGDRARWGVRTRPQPVCVDVEMVTLVRYEHGDPRERPMDVAPGERRTSMRFVMRIVSSETWKVAGLGARLPRPGWPPTEIDIERTLRSC